MPIFGRDRSELSLNLWIAVAGAAAGLGAGLAGYLLGRRRRPRTASLEERAIRLEDQVVDALAGDAVLHNRPIEVAMLSDGIIELTGMVGSEDEAHRAVDRAQEVPGVMTVLNRLDIGDLESHLAETRERYEAGDAALHETRWYGMRVGTGRRRQGHETDPARADDRLPMQSRELGTSRAMEQSSEELDKMAPGGEQHTSGPAAPLDRGTAEDASHRRLGNVEQAPRQDLNPRSGVHDNVKKGTELTLEESGVERERRRNRGEERR